MHIEPKSKSEDGTDPILRIKQILPILKIGRTTFHHLRKIPGLIQEPFSLQPAGRAKFWRLSDVIEMLDKLKPTCREPKLKSTGRKPN